MKLLVLLLMAIPCLAQLGVFKHGYVSTNNGVSIQIVRIHSSPRCKAEDNCPWAVIWKSKKTSQTVEISVTLAGFDSPVAVATVPGGKAAKLDIRNPVFQLPLSTVRQIDFRLWNGSKDLGTATFK
jgi:hypothetical protein